MKDLYKLICIIQPREKKTKPCDIASSPDRYMKIDSLFSPRQLTMMIPSMKLKGELVVSFIYRSEFHTQLGAMLSGPLSSLFSQYQWLKLIKEDFRLTTVSWLFIQQASTWCDKIRKVYLHICFTCYWFGQQCQSGAILLFKKVLD